MAIAIDTSVNGGSTALNTLAWNHTCTGSNLVLFATIIIGVLDLIGAVTYNGVAMTQVGKVQRGGSSRFIYLYYLVAPATGTNSLSVAVSAGGIDGGGSASYTGVNQGLTYTGTPTDNVNVGSGTGTTGSVAVTTIADNSWLVASYADGGGGTPSGGANTLLRQQIAGTSDALFDSNGAKTPPGSFAINTQTNNGSQAWGIVAASFSPAVVVNATPKLFTLLGAGS